MAMYEVFYKIRILSRDIYAHFPVPSPKFYILPGEEDSPYLIKMQINFLLRSGLIETHRPLHICQ